MILYILRNVSSVKWNYATTAGYVLYVFPWIRRSTRNMVMFALFHIFSCFIPFRSVIVHGFRGPRFAFHKTFV